MALGLEQVVPSPDQSQPAGCGHTGNATVACHGGAGSALRLPSLGAACRQAEEPAAGEREAHGGTSPRPWAHTQAHDPFLACIFFSKWDVRILAALRRRRETPPSPQRQPLPPPPRGGRALAWTAHARRHLLAGRLRQSPRGFLASGSTPCVGEGQSHRAGPPVSLCAQLRPEQRCALAAILGGESGRPAGGARCTPREPSGRRVRGRRAVPAARPRRPIAFFSPASGRHVLVHRAARAAQPLLRAALPAMPGWAEEACGTGRGAHHAAEPGGRVRYRRWEREGRSRPGPRLSAVAGPSPSGRGAVGGRLEDEEGHGGEVLAAPSAPRRGAPNSIALPVPPAKDARRSRIGAAAESPLVAALGLPDRCFWSRWACRLVLLPAGKSGVRVCERGWV